MLDGVSGKKLHLQTPVGEGAPDFNDTPPGERIPGQLAMGGSSDYQNQGKGRMMVPLKSQGGLPDLG